ncbi:hypothetical protein [Peribacillus simplex]
MDLLALLLSKTTATNPGIIIFIIDSLLVIAGMIIWKDLKFM